MIKYDVYKRPGGLFYRVALGAPLHAQSEVFAFPFGRWIKSGLRVGETVFSPRSSLVARNVVFKAGLCSQ